MRKILIIILFFGIFITNLRFCCLFRRVSMAYNDICDSEAMVVMEKSTERILYAKNQDKSLPMASTTKIITAIVAIEYCKDLDVKHLITKDMTGIEGSSIYLKAGEYLSVRELLYGLMLRSGNDAAVAIAIIVGGSIEEFVRMMNEFCLKLNMTNTNIVTVNGLHDDNHFTSAHDLAKASCYALKNSIFQEIVQTKEKVISNDLDKKYKCRLLKNKNKLLQRMEGADGVKTGFTTKAGKCFVGSATRNGMQLVCIVLNAKDMFKDNEYYLNKAFQEYSLEIVQDKHDFKIDKYSSKLQNSNIFVKNNTILPLKKEEINQVETRIEMFNHPQSDGQIGFQYFLVENNLIFFEKIYTIIDEKSTKNNSFADRFGKVIRAF